MHQKLVVTEVAKVSEPEPAIVEILVKLEGGDSATLRMNVFTAQTLFADLRSIAAA